MIKVTVRRFKAVLIAYLSFMAAMMLPATESLNSSNENELNLASIRGLSANTLVVFVCAGQSNMVGSRSKWSDVLAADIEKLEKALKGVCQFDGDQWLPYRIPERRFGPELAFAATMHLELERPVGIIHHARGGSNLAEDWNPEIADSLYQRLKEKVLAAQAARDIELVGMIWLQGENDSRDKLMSAAYGDNLKALIRRARADFNSPSMFFVAGRVNPHYPDAPQQVRYPYVAQVRAAQEGVTLRGYGWINTDDLSKVGDHLHYDTAGLVELGRRFAAKILDLDPGLGN